MGGEVRGAAAGGVGEFVGPERDPSQSEPIRANQSQSEPIGGVGEFVGPERDGHDQGREGAPRPDAA
eukprot:1894500-Prymnesium_polylepis.1